MRLRKLVGLAFCAVVLAAVGTGCSEAPGAPGGTPSANGRPSQAWVDYSLDKAFRFWFDRGHAGGCWSFPAIQYGNYDFPASGGGFASGCNTPGGSGGPGTITLDNTATWTRGGLCVVMTHEIGHLIGYAHGDFGPLMSEKPPWGAAYCP